MTKILQKHSNLLGLKNIMKIKQKYNIEDNNK